MTRLFWRGVGVVSGLVSLAACGGAPPVVAPVVVTIAEPAREKTLSEEPAGPDAGPVPITAADPSSGAADAPVTLVQIGDFGNPFCAQMAPWIRAIRARYPLDRLRIVYKSVPDPDRPESVAAAAAGLSVFANAGAGAFWSFHADAFAAYPDLSPAAVERWAARAGVAAEPLRRSQTSPSIERAIARTTALARQLDVVAPQILVNGVWVLSLSSADALQTAIDAELRRADQLLAAGMPRGKVHAARAAENLAIKAGRSAKDRDPAPAVGGGKFGAKHLLVMYEGSRRSAPDVTRTKDQALARVREALKRARAGERFEDLVKEYSDEPGAAKRGGDLGTFPAGAMVHEFQKGLEETEVGKISDVVETPFGFHVILRTK
ncbi:MAG: peptidylprolyl isomerase [Byssovorax sp.]